MQTNSAMKTRRRWTDFRRTGFISYTSNFFLKQESLLGKSAK